MSGHVVLDGEGKFIPWEPDYPVSGDLIARFLDDPRPVEERRTRRYPLGDLLWPKIAKLSEARFAPGWDWEGRSAVLERIAL